MACLNFDIILRITYYLSERDALALLACLRDWWDLRYEMRFRTQVQLTTVLNLSYRKCFTNVTAHSINAGFLPEYLSELHLDLTNVHRQRMPLLDYQMLKEYRFLHTLKITRAELPIHDLPDNITRLSIIRCGSEPISLPKNLTYLECSYYDLVTTFSDIQSWPQTLTRIDCDMNLGYPDFDKSKKILPDSITHLKLYESNSNNMVAAVWNHPLPPNLFKLKIMPSHLLENYNLGHLRCLSVLKIYDPIKIFDHTRLILPPSLVKILIPKKHTSFGPAVRHITTRETSLEVLPEKIHTLCCVDLNLNTPRVLANLVRLKVSKIDSKVDFQCFPQLKYVNITAIDVENLANSNIQVLKLNCQKNLNQLLPKNLVSLTITSNRFVLRLPDTLKRLSIVSCKGDLQNMPQLSVLKIKYSKINLPFLPCGLTKLHINARYIRLLQGVRLPFLHTLFLAPDAYPPLSDVLQFRQPSQYIKVIIGYDVHYTSIDIQDYQDIVEYRY